MKLYFTQVYLKPGVEFPFSYHVQAYLSDELTPLVVPSGRFIEKYGRRFHLTFYVSAKQRIKDNQIKGPGVYRKTNDVEYTIFLPFDAIGRRRETTRAALEFLLKGVCSVLKSLEIDTSKIAAAQESMINHVCATPKMFNGRAAIRQALGADKSQPNYENPVVEKRWCKKQRALVAKYLRSQKVKHGHIGDWPAWHIAPIAAIWAIESLVAPGCIGWWVITGDFPTDYISSADVWPPQHPRKAMRVIAKQWLKQAKAWKAGRDYKGIRIAGARSHKALAPALATRANILIEWTDADSMWEEE